MKTTNAKLITVNAVAGILNQVKLNYPTATHFAVIHGRTTPACGTYRSDAAAAADLLSVVGPARMFKLDYQNMPHEIYRKES